MGNLYGVSGEAVRNSVRRYNKKTIGSYTGFNRLQPVQMHPDNITESSTPKEVEESVQSFISDVMPRIVIIDIERLPNVGFFWHPRTRDGWVPESMVLEPSRMISFAAKQLKGPTFFSSEFHHGRDNMLRSLWDIMDSADILVTYNGKRFDVPHIAGELRDAGYQSYRPFKQIDLLQVIKNKFGYDYKTLKSVSARWGLSEKLETGGMDLWRRCYEGDAEAWNAMKEYNIQDVRVTEAVYLENLSWLAGSIPNLGLWLQSEGSLVCPACSSNKVVPHGSAVTGVSRYAMYRCTQCGYHSRSNEKLASTTLRPVTW